MDVVAASRPTMDTSGGFLLSTAPEQAGPSRDGLGSERGDREDESSLTVRKLTGKQETRLMNYLDDALLEISRGYNKRHNTGSSSLATLDAFLRAYSPVLALIASIPPIGPSASLLVSYLLRLTNELLEGITGYEAGDDIPGSPMLDQELQHVVESLGLLDRVWSCVLRGQMIDMAAAKDIVEMDTRCSQFEDHMPGSRGVAAATTGTTGTASLQSLSSGRFPPADPSSHHPRLGRAVMGSKGFSTVAQTNRIRLRNLLTLAKESLFAWMRVQLDVPLPPTVDGSDDGDGVGDGNGKGDSDRKADAGGNAEGDEPRVGDELKREAGSDEEEVDLEEVDTGGMAHESTTDGSAQTHFDALFARTIDPDADDSDADEDQKEQTGKRLHSPSELDGPNGAATATSPLKRPRRNDDDDDSEVPPSDVESTATFAGSAAVMKWDVQFARLFAHTQRCLSDIQEFSNRREGAEERP